MTEMTIHRGDAAMARTDATAASLATREPALSQALRVASLRIADPHDRDAGASITEATRSEAQAAVARYEALLISATDLQIATWLGEINAGCRIPMEQAALRTKVLATWRDLAHLPGACFTAETRRAVAMRTAYYPGLGDILAVCEPVAEGLRRQLRIMRRIAAGGGGAPGSRRRGPTPEMTIAEVPSADAQLAGLAGFEAAKVAVAAKAASFRAEMRQVEERMKPPPQRARARFLTPREEIRLLEDEIAAGRDPQGSLTHLLEVTRRRVDGCDPATTTNPQESRHDR